MVTIIEFLLQSAMIFLMIAIPGFLASVAIFKRSNKFNTLELFLLGLPIGMFVPALLGILEGDIGILFSPALAIFNVILLTAAAIGYLLVTKTKILPDKKPGKDSLIWGAGLLVVLFLAFWVRMQALSPYYYDFDPYWYNQMTQFIIQQGQVPVHDDYVWYPNPSTHRSPPLLAYMEAGWYHVFSMANGMQSFDFNTMTLVSSIYPPLVAMLTAFAAYLWMSREYNKSIGLIAAGLMAFMPVLVEKTVAPLTEQGPFGFFSLVFFYAMYALAFKYESKTFALLASFALAIGLIGSNTGQILPILFGGIVGFTGLVAFLRGKDISKFLDFNLIVAAGSVVAFALFLPYRYPLWGFDIVKIFLPAWLGVIAAYFLNYMRSFAKTFEDKLLYLSGIGVVVIVLLLLTPLHDVLDTFMNLFGFVTSYNDPTFKTIAELGQAPTDFSSTLGILGLNIPFSITPILLVASFIAAAAPLAISLYKRGNEMDESRMLVGVAGVMPIALSGLFKSKFAPYMGLMAPLAFCILIGEIGKAKKFQLAAKVAIGIAAIAVLIQGMQYMDVVFKSVSWYSIDVSDNTAFLNSVCTTINSEANTVAASNMPGPIKSILYGAKAASMRTYCSRIPEYWLEPMFWIRDNVAIDDRVMSWWDYGHWINSFGQRKSVTGNTHEYTMMHQEVADKLVHGNSSDLIDYMKSHKAKYLLLDQDLVGKWGALVYHSCVYNNYTTLAQDPGESECDMMSSPEVLYVPKSPTSSDVCALKSSDGQSSLKLYSSMGQAYGFGYYCSVGGTLPFYYENKTAAGIENVLQEGDLTSYAAFMALYPSDSLDRKGTFYDSIFYKGFFEGHIDGLTQVYPSTYSTEPNLPVRIYKLDE
ncbi:Oligosaccharyl transferase STT3 subunit [uncultured archaeon]|nr:Oligosaccharyl transferase STT3 subunit [uncultured archaeon]